MRNRVFGVIRIMGAPNVGHGMPCSYTQKVRESVKV